MLGSGSSGNSTYVASEQTALLIDAGLSARQIGVRLAEVGVTLAELHGICVSHEHQDHTRALRLLHQKHGLDVYLNAGTAQALARYPEFQTLRPKIFTTGHAFQIGDLTIEPFSVPHDAYDPVGFIVAHGAERLGVVTDMGMATSLIRERLRTCQAVVVESNHDEQLLQDAARPWSLKQRIRGRQGHLSNQGAAHLLTDIAGPSLSHVFLAHLSEDCNHHDLARDTILRALAEHGHSHIQVCVAQAHCISEIWCSATWTHAAQTV